MDEKGLDSRWLFCHTGALVVLFEGESPPWQNVGVGHGDLKQTFQACLRIRFGGDTKLTHRDFNIKGFKASEELLVVRRKTGVRVKPRERVVLTT